jgi:hypothetical protein
MSDAFVAIDNDWKYTLLKAALMFGTETPIGKMHGLKLPDARYTIP